MGVFRRASEPEAWDYATIYTPKGVAREVAQRYCWPNDEDEIVGLVVCHIREDGLMDMRVNPVFVTVSAKSGVWLYARNLRSKLVGDTYVALECEGVKVKGMATCTHFRGIPVDFVA